METGLAQKTVAVAQTATKFTNQISHYLDIAKSKLGEAYTLNGPNDCSGFVYKVLKESGIDIKRQSTYEWNAHGCSGFSEVNESQNILPGDILLFDGHMGIITSVEDNNNFYFIHSEGGSGAGKVVISQYGSQKYYGRNLKKTKIFRKKI